MHILAAQPLPERPPVLTGFLVSSVGVFLWSLILAVLPGAWPILPMIGVLWAYWKYFSGNFGTNATTRKEKFRLTSLQPSVWKWGLAGAALFVIVVQHRL